MVYSLTVLVKGKLDLIERFESTVSDYSTAGYLAINYALAHWPESGSESNPCFVHDEQGNLFATLLPVVNETLSCRVVYQDGTTQLYTDISYITDNDVIVGAEMSEHDSLDQPLTSTYQLWHDAF